MGGAAGPGFGPWRRRAGCKAARQSGNAANRKIARIDMRIAFGALRSRPGPALTGCSRDRGLPCAESSTQFDYNVAKNYDCTTAAAKAALRWPALALFRWPLLGSVFLPRSAVRPRRNQRL